MKLEVIALVSSSQIQDERIKAQMASKYPERSTTFPDRVIKGRTVENLRGLRESLLNMSKRRGKAPGTGGGTHEASRRLWFEIYSW